MAVMAPTTACRSLSLMVLCMAAATTLICSSVQVQAFVIAPLPSQQTVSCVFHRSSSDDSTAAVDDGPRNIDDHGDDAALLASVTKDQLLALCRQCHIELTDDDDAADEYDKASLLLRLRQHADEQAQAAKDRLKQRRVAIQEGSENEKERYERSDETASYGMEEEEDEPFFFFEDPHLVVPPEAAAPKQPVDPLDKPMITSADITSPPFPTEPNANGERVVTTYSTKDQNDLTGIAASQPTHGVTGDLAGTMGAPTTAQSQPWDAAASTQTSQKQKETDAAMEVAREQVTELVAGLLSSTHAPGFLQDDDVASLLPMPRTIFDPSTVPSDLLDSCAVSLRTGRGQVLHDVLYEFEMRAVGYDGLAGDDMSRGGGHYQAVQHVRAFLDGYRKAQVRSFARETATLLLDKLVQEGVNGLDMTLATMGRSNDDVAGSGELNESLMEFLNDVIRQQEKKVDRLVSERMDALDRSLDASFSKGTGALNEGDGIDPMDQLWNVTTNDEGKRIETIDPNDPKVKHMLEEELQKTNADAVREKIPDTAPEQLLLLLSLLRERIKVEATFVMDEKSRNLRLLAYCLRLGDDQEREQLIFNQLGKSLDGLDSFIELVSSSIEYGESTSYELQPAKKRVLNVPQIKHILRIAKEVKKKQSIRASGLLP